MRALLERAPDIDGVFAASDAVAAGALEALRAAGRRVPEDVGVVGFDDSAWARRTLPALSTVHQPAEGLGRQAAVLVLEQLRGDPAPRSAPRLRDRLARLRLMRRASARLDDREQDGRVLDRLEGVQSVRDRQQVADGAVP